MYGLVNQAVKDLIINRYGQSSWDQICSRLHISPESFDPMKSYPDELTDQVISAASEYLDVSTEKLLHDLGDYWITFTAEEGYGDLMTMFGKDFRGCLKNLNRMHAQIAAMMPELNPPRFVVEEMGANKILIHYYSIRKGLSPMVIGLLEGLARKFGKTIRIEPIEKGKRSDHDEFEVEFI